MTQELRMDSMAAEIGKYRMGLTDLATRHELAEGFAASSKVSTELRKHLIEVEAAVNRQRGRLEQGLHDSTDGLGKATSELADLKARMQSETTTLGSELSLVRAAA